MVPRYVRPFPWIFLPHNHFLADRRTLWHERQYLAVRGWKTQGASLPKDVVNHGTSLAEGVCQPRFTNATTLDEHQCPRVKLISLFFWLTFEVPNNTL